MRLRVATLQVLKCALVCFDYVVSLSLIFFNCVAILAS